MALSGKLNADFASFFAACQQAQVELKGFDTETKNVEKSLQRMTDEFSGVKIQTEAALMAEAIERLGGVSKLTDAELQRVGASADEAAQKMIAMGQAVPPGLQKIRDASADLRNTQEGAAKSSQEFSQAMGQVDGILGRVGINTNGTSKAISELAEMAGKSATEVGLLGTAGAVVGAAVAGWNIGRSVAEFFDLDQTIGNATAKLLGFGDAAAEAAGAKADTLARASKIAGFEVSQLSTATVIFNEQQKNAIQTTLDATARITAWHGELAKAGVNTDKLSADIKTQVFSVEELATKYDVSVEAIQNYIREQKTAADATEVASKKIEAANARKLKDLQTELTASAKFRDAMTELNSAGKGWIGTLDTIDGNVVEAIKYYLQAGVSQKALAEAYELTDAQVKAVASSMAAEAETEKTLITVTEQLSAAKAKQLSDLEKEIALREKAAAAKKKEADAIAAEKAKNRAQGGSMDYDLSTAEGMAQFKKANPGATVGVGTEYFLAHTLQQAIAAGYVDLYAAFKGLTRVTLAGIPHFATGGVSRGGAAIVGERGPELVNLPGGARVTPGGGGGGVNVTVNMSGMLLSNSPAARAEFADFAGKALIAQLQARGWRHA